MSAPVHFGDPLAHALLDASRVTRTAYETAKREGREDVADELATAGFQIAAAIAVLAGPREAAS